MSSDIRDPDVSGHGGNGGAKRRRIMGLLSGATPSAAAGRSAAPPSPFVASPPGSPLAADTAASAATDTDLLSSDPFDDDLGKELRTRAPRASLSRTTMALAGSVLIVAGFLGGVIVQKNWGATSSTRGNGTANGAANAANGGFSGFGGRNGGTGGTNSGTAGGTGTGAGAVTTGTVKLVDGTTIYLTTANGDVITVKTTGTTAVKIQQSGALKDIPVGATISVQGTADSDGIVTATQVTSTK